MEKQLVARLTTSFEGAAYNEIHNIRQNESFYWNFNFPFNNLCNIFYCFAFSKKDIERNDKSHY